MKVVLLVILAGLMHAATRFSSTSLSDASLIALASGFILLAGFLAGQLTERMGLPRLTGYLLTGFIAGPQLLGFLSPSVMSGLEVFNGVAIALIALSAGSEMHVRSLKPLLKTIRWVTLLAVGGTSLLLTAALYFLSEWLPFLQVLPELQRLALAAVMSLVLVAQSPAMVVALRDETKSEGQVIQSALAVVVFADLVLILCFALGSTAVQLLFDAQASVLVTAGNLAWEFLGSALFGVLFGALLAVFMKKVPGGGALFVIAIAVVMAEVGRRLQFDPLLVALSAGIFVRNIANDLAERLQHDISQASYPVYIAFFALAGAHISLSNLENFWLPVLLLVCVRGLGLYLGTRAAAAVAKAPTKVARYAGFGLIPQAGLAFALTLVFQRNFDFLGNEPAALILSVIAFNQLLAPPLFTWALKKAGEWNQRSQGVNASQEPPTLSVESP